MDDEERERRRDIIYKARDGLDEARAFNEQLDAHVARRDLSQPDPFEARRQRLRDEQPKPHQPANDTAAARAHWESTWNNWADARIGAAIDQYHEMMMEVVAYALGKRCRALLDEIAVLRAELDNAQSEIKVLRTLQRGATATILSWSFDRKHYRAIPTMSDGKPGAPLDLYPFFAQYQTETAT